MPAEIYVLQIYSLGGVGNKRVSAGAVIQFELCGQLQPDGNANLNYWDAEKDRAERLFSSFMA